ncbi:glycoside hydrolase family 128 protein [Xylaria arbuscula]|nr:glycoside hydrolase family 128 protein [Xylaria arbuscula]
MVIQKRQILWDWTNSSGPGNPGIPDKINQVPFGPSSPVASVSNWNAWVPPELRNRAPFRPMVRVLQSAQGSDWAMIQDSKEPIILFFNEPERSGITPEQASDIWHKQMLPLKKNKGKKLGSPAVASDDQGRQWIEKFMSLVSSDLPDFLCLHYYSRSADEAIKYVEEMHKKWPKIKLMVTEIACIDHDYQAVLNFTVKACNWMDTQDFIFEYGLFDFQRKVADNFVSPAAQLMDANGNFTELGNMYVHQQPMKLPGKANSEAHAMTALNAPTALSPDKQKALEAQNQKRKTKGLNPLTWDDQLTKSAEAYAQHLAKIGKLEHSPGDSRSNQGENLAWASSSNTPFTMAVNMWLAEEKSYHGEPIGQGDFASYGHYTQCMWKSTTKVGMASAKDAKGGVYIVGRYFPSGNSTGQKPY